MTIEPSRMPRPEWAPPPTVTRSVSPATKRTASIGTPSHSQIKLRKARLVALALRDDADDEFDDAFRQDRDFGLLARHAGRDVDVIGRRAMPRYLPRFFASARRRLKPAQSPSLSAVSMAPI